MMTMNEQMTAEVILSKIHNGGWVVGSNSDNYPYVYTNADKQLLVSQEAEDDYGGSGIDNMLSLLSVLLMKSLQANDDDDFKNRNRLTRLSRGIMKELGISSSRRSQIWDGAPPELMQSLNAHQAFFEKVGELYDSMIINHNHMPLIKNHGGYMVGAGWQISKKMRAHTHRQAKRTLRAIRRGEHQD
jgi:hypothetical protein|tara:strand:+ start:668 stop:1228 length:561 start_codon:yes stop_codon:yes gene_type:complete